MNFKKSIAILALILVAPFFVYTKRVMDAAVMHKKMINERYWFKVLPLSVILQKYPEISYQKCLEKVAYDFAQFPPSNLFPHKGVCDDCFILRIPHARVRGLRGDVFIENNLIEEMIYKNFYLGYLDMSKTDEDTVIKVAGRVAVITQDLTGYYFHWFQDVLGRLALLELQGYEWDYLYVPYDKPYIKQTLELWGIDPKKIISPDSNKFCIQADEVILPSYTMNKNQGLLKYAGFHYNPVTMKYVSEKLLKAAQKKNIDTSKFSKKVFITRKNAPYRCILNEDEIFELFQDKGFVRYELGDLLIAEQILLFQNAEMIVGEHGAGLTNCLFCKPGTRVIEIFQALIDSGPWWITQVMGMDYSCIMTVQVDANYFAHFGVVPEIYRNAWRTKRSVSIDCIKKIVEKIN